MDSDKLIVQTVQRITYSGFARRDDSEELCGGILLQCRPDSEFLVFIPADEIRAVIRRAEPLGRPQWEAYYAN